MDIFIMINSFYFFTIQVHSLTLKTWDMKPFIYHNNVTNVTEGIFVDYRRRIYEKCAPENTSNANRFEDEKSFGKNYREFLKDLNTSTYEENVSYLFFPVLAEEPKYNYNKYTQTNLMYSTGATIIIQRSEIDNLQKIIHGLKETKKWLIFSLLFSVIIAIVVWFLERDSNEDFRGSFPIGCLHAFYFAIVSMATVGYGDMAPKSLSARILILFFIFYSMVMSAMITANITDTLSGGNYEDLEDKTVAVLMHSTEKLIAEQYHGVPLEKHSYDDVISAVRFGEAYAAIINTDVASWISKEIKGGRFENDVPLSFVYRIDYQIPIIVVERRLEDLTNSHKLFHDCLNENMIAISRAATKQYFRHIKIESSYSTPVLEFFTSPKKLGFIFVVLMILCVFLACSEEIVKQIVKRKTKKELPQTVNNSSIGKSYQMVHQIGRDPTFKPDILKGLRKHNLAIKHLKTDADDMKSEK